MSALRMDNFCHFQSRCASCKNEIEAERCNFKITAPKLEIYHCTYRVFSLYPRNGATLNRNIDCVQIVALLLRLTYFPTCDSSKHLSVCFIIIIYTPITVNVKHTRSSVDKKPTGCHVCVILYFSFTSCSTCFGQPCAHLQGLTTAQCYRHVLMLFRGCRKVVTISSMDTLPANRF